MAGAARKGLGGIRTDHPGPALSTGKAAEASRLRGRQP